MSRRIPAALTVLVVAVLVGGARLPAFAASPGDVTGRMFQDLDRDGVLGPGEEGFGGQGLVLYDSTGRAIASAKTDPSGRYTFTDVPAGSYRLEVASPDWAALRDTWVPTTTGSLFFRRAFTVDGPVTVDFGLRQIVRSTTPGSPITSYTGQDGLRVESYNDVVPARDVYDAVSNGLVGAEKASVRIWFDLGDVSDTTFTYGGADGSFVGYSAKVKVDYLTWLSEPAFDATLGHEYGHAWSMYYALMVQQDSTMSGYLQARGLYGDSRLGKDVFWDPKEMIAEDYRQLFGSATARLRPQANTQIPAAADVPGLRTYLHDIFTQPASGEPAPSPTPTGTPSPSDSPTITTSPTPTISTTSAPSPSPSPTGTTTPSPSPSPTGTTTASPTPTQAPLTLSQLTMDPAPVTRSGTATATLSGSASLTLRVETPSGELVRTLLSGPASQGTVSATWDRKGADGRRAKGGTYVLVAAATDGSTTTTATDQFEVK